MKVIFRVGSMAACLIGLVAFTNGARGRSSAVDLDQQSAHGHLSGLMAKITMRDGYTRTVKLEGVGCAQSMCSRTAIKAKTHADSLVRTWLDTLSAIKNTTPTDALFVLKDGTSRRMSLVNGFRVLYLGTRLGGADRLDLAMVKAVEFLAPEP